MSELHIRKIVALGRRRASRYRLAKIAALAIAVAASIYALETRLELPRFPGCTAQLVN